MNHQRYHQRTLIGPDVAHGGGDHCVSGAMGRDILNPSSFSFLVNSNRETREQEKTKCIDLTCFR